MARGKSKAEAALRELKDTVVQAEQVSNRAYEEYAKAKAVAGALAASYDALEQLLASATRKTAPKSTPVPSAAKKSKEKRVSTGTEKETVTTADVCADCGEGRDYYIHSPENTVAGHKFRAETKTKGASA